MLLSWIVKTLNIQWQGEDREISGISIDSRDIKTGELFVAICGALSDGHDYLQQAADRGGAAALVSQTVKTDLPTLKVENTEAALLLLAKKWRDQFSIPMVAVTGSCGKTSTRALIQGIFSACGDTLASVRSYNNSIGVPLTLLRLRPGHQYAVFEIGANHPGEIAELVQIVRPSVAIITMAAMSHLAGFGDLDGIAKAKAEIFQTLDDQGVAVINQDDHYAAYWRRLVAPHKVISFGLENKAEVMATDIKYDNQACPSFNLITPVGQVDIKLALMGKHNVYNALAAVTCALALGLPLDKIKQGLESVVAESRRLVGYKGYAKALIIDDSYNANPASVQAAIDVLSHYQGTSVLVLGDMLELGQNADKLHREIGRAANHAGIEHLFCFGEYAEGAADAFGQRGQHFNSQQDLIFALRPLLNDKVTVLVKGSNSMGMQKVAQSLMKE